MSKDIRSFFKVSNVKKSGPTSSPSSASAAKPKRKANALNSSDDEKEVVKHVDPKKKRRIVDSDEEIEKPKSKSSSHKKSAPTQEKKKLVEVDVLSMYGSDPVKRKIRPKVEKPSPNANVIELDDSMDLDVSLVADEMEKQEMSRKNVVKASPGEKKEDAAVKDSKEEKNVNKASPAKKAETSSNGIKSEVKSPSKSSPSSRKRASPSDKPRTPRDSSSSKPRVPSKSPTPKKAKAAESKSGKKEKKPKETTVEDDEARHERKQMAAALFHKFQNRAAVLNPGCKEIPVGKPDCLKGLVFVISGVLEAMERQEAADLIKSCGGAVVLGLSKKVTHFLCGEDAGPAKTQTAKDLGVKEITEDELLSMIRRKSGLPEPSAVDEVKKDSPGKENRVTNEEATVKQEVKKESPKEAPSVPLPLRPAAAPKNFDDCSFVDKYKPTSIAQIIGQQGATGHAQKLMHWLNRWHSNNDGKKKHAKPSPWAKNNDGSAFKAALLSGSPGVGKTTTAHLVCQELMFDIVEFNASDTRSKRLLKEEVSSLISNKSLAGYLNGTETKVSMRHVLIMDEVDGMAGNEDRGGVAELIALIKESRIPVICMCNDRNHPKIRSLANHCFDLRFHKPSLQQVRSAMMTICFKEGIKLEAGAIDEIISGTGNDIRQTLNHLALYSASKDVKLSTTDAKKNAQMSEKDVKISQFEVIRKVFSAEEHQKMTFNDKSDLFFHDYNMAPLFVQENYLKVKPKCGKSEMLKRVALAADSLSLGDLVEKRIRSSMAWSLLPTQAVFSSVLPGEYMEGTLTTATNFPMWLGKTSRSNKLKRMAQEVHDHTRIATSGSRLSVRLDYAPFLVQAIVGPLKEKGLDGVPEALKVIKEYRLLREDIDSLLELTTWPNMKNPWKSVDSKVKAALTRAYNKEVQPYSYSAQAGVKKKSARAADSEEVEGYEEDDAAPSEDEQEDDSSEINVLIKVKKPAASKELKAGTSKAGSSSSKASSSKGLKSKGKK